MELTQSSLLELLALVNTRFHLAPSCLSGFKVLLAASIFTRVLFEDREQEYIIYRGIM